MHNGDLVEPRCGILDKWLSDDLEVRMMSKELHFKLKTLDNIDDYVAPWWSQSTIDALKTCFHVVREFRDVKESVERLNTEVKIKRMTDLLANSDVYYEKMISALETALSDSTLGPDRDENPFTPYQRRRKTIYYFRHPSEALRSCREENDLIDELYAAHFEDSPEPSSQVAMDNQVGLVLPRTPSKIKRALLEAEEDSPLYGKRVRRLANLRRSAGTSLTHNAASGSSRG